MTDSPDAKLELDLRGLNCPLPVLRTRKALATMAPGERVRVITTDPGSEIDLRVLAEVNGHQVLSFDTQPDRFVFLIEKGAPAA
ncbi:MAG: sulfurtransferase TusA family protein [Burkholderiales bacterium]